MKILFTSIPALGESLNKYGIEFTNGKANEVEDPALIKKLLSSPYFSEVVEFVERVETKKAAPVKKAVKKTVIKKDI